MLRRTAWDNNRTPSRCQLHPANAQKFSWLTTCIYIAILFVEYPTNWAIQRVPIAKYLGISITLWGTVLALHSTATKFVHLVVLRTLLFRSCVPAEFCLLEFYVVQA